MNEPQAGGLQLGLVRVEELPSRSWKVGALTLSRDAILAFLIIFVPFLAALWTWRIEARSFCHLSYIVAKKNGRKLASCTYVLAGMVICMVMLGQLFPKVLDSSGSLAYSKVDDGLLLGSINISVLGNGTAVQSPQVNLGLAESSNATSTGEEGQKVGEANNPETITQGAGQEQKSLGGVVNQMEEETGSGLGHQDGGPIDTVDEVGIVSTVQFRPKRKGRRRRDKKVECITLPVIEIPRTMPSIHKEAERLPPGIIAQTSDLFKRRLWGSPDDDLPMKPIYLFAVAVGLAQIEIVNKMVSKLSNRFTIMLFHYDGHVNDWEALQWPKEAIHIAATKQTKWFDSENH
ncbi:hypothetical protein CBR_g2845 [Chara braunii]|uniref:Uncharacterized protein n=1 Tax=Chara braunii TaxID=69332 RepID=A0A388KE21_CHABU|nr:hypothetical protein CBR_g2845 [Chara braunii]|eukprot:GBG68299.1 hypothetical protein CBR_g2845 [Chara braunii]